MVTSRAKSSSVNLLDTEAQIGNNRKVKVTESTVKTPTHAERLGSGRQMKVDTKSYRQGEWIAPHLTYALRAPNGRCVPIPEQDLEDWQNKYFNLGINKKGNKAFYVKEPGARGLWEGKLVDEIPLKQGTWTVLQSDEDWAVIPQTQTAPLEHLQFELNERGVVVASYCDPDKQSPTEEKPPLLKSLATQATRVHNKKT